MATQVPTTVRLQDREWELRFDFDAIDRLSDLPRAQRGNRNPVELWGDANGLDVRAMGLMVWAATRHQDPENEFTVDRATNAVRASLRFKRISYKELNEALNAAINQSEVVGLFKPDQLEDGQGNAARKDGTSD